MWKSRCTGPLPRPGGRRNASVMETLMTIAEQSLLQTRRPVLLAPVRLQSDLTDSVMIAWDEYRMLARGLGSIPFMLLPISAGHQR